MVAPVRQKVLLGVLAGVVLGSATGFCAGTWAERQRASVAAFTASSPFVYREASGATGEVARSPVVVRSFPHVSFSRDGEDLVLDRILRRLRVPTPTYLEVGPRDPVIGSNTFLFYVVGGRGVLVGASAEAAAKLASGRPGDTVLSARAAAWGAPETAVPVVDVNAILAERFPDGPPDLLAIDGAELAAEVVRSLPLSLARNRPKVICATTRTSELAPPRAADALASRLLEHHYTVRASTPESTIFVADEALEAAARARAASGSGGAE